MAILDQYGFKKGDKEFNVKRMNQIISQLNEASDLLGKEKIPSFVPSDDKLAQNGASDTTTQDLVGYGTLDSFLPQAQNLYNKLYTKSPEEKEREDRINTGMMFLNFFTKMGAEASRPGATGLGAANIAGADTASMYINQVNAERARKDAERKGVIGLASQLQTQANAREIALGKAKKGAPKVVEFGPAMKKDGTQKVDEKGNQLFTFNVYDPLGKIIQTYDAPRKGGISVNVGDKSAKKFGEVFSSSQAKKFGEYLDASSAAVDSMVTVDTLLDFLANPDFKTGVWQDFILPLKSLGLSFGLFKNDDKTIDNIANAEAFRAKAYEIVLNSVQKMKGALSNKELGFLSAQGPTLSKSKEGNKLLLYLNKHQLNKAAQFRSYVIQWSDDNNDGKFPQDSATYNRMIDEWKSSDIMKQNPYQYIKSESEKFFASLIRNAGGDVDENGQVIPGSISADSFQEQQKIDQIFETVNNKFSLNMLAKVFKNSGFME